MLFEGRLHIVHALTGWCLWRCVGGCCFLGMSAEPAGKQSAGKDGFYVREVTVIPPVKHHGYWLRQTTAAQFDNFGARHPPPLLQMKTSTNVPAICGRWMS